MRQLCRRATHVSSLMIALASPLRGQERPEDPGRLTIDRIFGGSDFRSAPMPSVHWLSDGSSYVDLRSNPAGGSDIVRVDLVTGDTTVLADAAAIVDESGRRIDIEEVQLSDDESRALLFHRSVRVWRSNTRGVFHVLDFASRKVTPVAVITTPGRPATTPDSGGQPMLGRSPSFLARGLGSGAVDSTLQMFAKFSPDGRQVAFVRGNDLWVTDLATGRSKRLTFDGSDDIINGTTDWVYEEELGLRDAFRWSPDSRRLAYWRFDQTEVPAFPMVDETGLYPVVSVLRYPKAGEANSRVRVGILDIATAQTKWIDVGGDTGQYVARMEWNGNDSVVVQRLPRKQNRVDVLMLSATSGAGRTVLTDRDSAYVDVEEQPRWVARGRQFLWLSDRTGWRQLHLHDRSGRAIRQLTTDGVDILGVVAVDEARGVVYVSAAAPDPTQRQVFRVRLDGRGRMERVTTAPGSHSLSIGPGARFAVDVHSSITSPPTATLYELPAMRSRRVMMDNAQLRERLAALRTRPATFIKVPTPSGVVLDGWRIVPPDFDSTKKYPVLMYVYGGPASPTVTDSYGGTRWLWHQMLAQLGYVVVSVDNRGAAWRGRDFRKITQYRLGRYESQDQIDAAKWLASQPWVDGKRIGIWGWSYGGYMSSLVAGRAGESFRAAIAVAPVSDWRLYDTIYTERFMWTPRENAEGYREGAPLTHVGGMTARLLVVHGTGDDNVHPQNTIQLANRLEAAGKHFWMLLYPNRTHSISGGTTQAHLFDSLTRFIRESL